MEACNKKSRQVIDCYYSRRFIGCLQLSLGTLAETIAPTVFHLASRQRGGWNREIQREYRPVNLAVDFTLAL
jgi:hypothetical protein